MLGNKKFSVKLFDNFIEIENKTDKHISNCFLSATDIFYLTLLNDVTNFEPNEIKSYPILGNNFREQTKDGKIYLKIYSDDRLIYETKLNDKNKCYVIFSNEKFQPLIEQLIIGLDKYSNEKIFHYSINYESNLEYKNLENIYMHVDGDMSDGQFMQFIKPRVFLDILERGYKECAFLDADIQIRSNIDNVFNYFTEIEDGPLLQKNMWDYTIVQGNYVPGPLLTEAMDLPKQKYPQGVTNIVLFNQSHKELFKEWNEICFSDKIDQIRRQEFMHDELILNCLMWKRDVKPKLFWFFLNVLTVDDVQFFYNYKFNGYEHLVDMNLFTKGHAFQSFIPYDKSQVVGFHCVKDPSIAKDINNLIEEKEFPNFKNSLVDFYNNIKKSENVINPKYQDVTFLNHFIDGALMEVRSKEDKEFRVEFWNKQGVCEYVTNIRSNMWTKPNKKYFDEWTCKVYDGDKLIYNKKYDATGRRVFITLESKSIGDTLAWFPYVDEFRKKWNCDVICSTFWNHLFVDTYPEIEFVNPGSVVNNIYAMYSVGWFYNEDDTFKTDRNPRDFKEVSLGQTAADILGLDFEYIKAKINIPEVEKQKRVGIAIHSTAQTKYWNNPTGWQEVTDFLIVNGYEVLILSKENDGYMGNFHPKGANKLPEGSMENLMEVMKTCEFFIGVGSGLSWVSWTLDIPTVLISGFSKPISEFGGDNVIRVFNSSVCNGCYNRFRLDAGDWNWCPDQKGTDRQFECTKSITGKMVIDAIKSKGWIKELETQDYIL